VRGRGEAALADRRAVSDPSQVALLDRARELLEPHAAEIVEDFYARAADRPAISEVLARLTPAELADVKGAQADHVLALVDSRLDLEALHERGRAVGRIHTLAGVEMDLYVDSVADHRRGIVEVLSLHADELDLAQANDLLNERFMRDLHGSLLGYRAMDSAQNRVMLEVISAVSEARTVADLSQGLVDGLSQLDGMAVCFFARPDDSGWIQYETGAGEGFENFIEDVTIHGQPFITTGHSTANGQGPLGRAWRSGDLQLCHSYQMDPTTVPWRGLTRRFGWCSSAAVPLVDRRGNTRALLALQSLFPGYFAAEARVAMLEQVKRATERALADLEQRPTLTSGVSAYGARANHLAKLAAGEVQMLYQPVVSLPDGRLTKVEALARLRDGDRLISPAEFLPAFGDDALFELFRIGVHQSLEQLRTWQQQGLSTGVSINLPVVSTGDPRYVGLVAEVLREYDVASSRLTLELLESGFVNHPLNRRGRFLDEFKDLGVRLSQDDLGSGYSSLLRLRHFAFDEVKIDQGLVRGTEMAPGAALHFIEPINDIAHSLGLDVVIEGLENDGLIEAAIQLGVDAGQGYGIARPMPADALLPWARGYRLDVDPRQPRTAIGALAGHVAWEHRVAILGEHYPRESFRGSPACPLTGFLARSGAAVDVTAAHEHVHAAALDSGRGSVIHRAAWDRLAAVITRE
jgi:EAL domain-containing protein (putative c-di-GMP-specific phosphodiesterase class I)